MDIEYVYDSQVSVAIRLPDHSLFYNFGTNSFEQWDFSVAANTVKYVKDMVPLASPLANYWVLDVDLSAFSYKNYSVLILDKNNSYKTLSSISYRGQIKVWDSKSWINILPQGA